MGILDAFSKKAQEKRVAVAVMKAMESYANEHTGPAFDIADSTFAAYFRLGAQSVNEIDAWFALRQPAIWAAATRIANIIMTLELKSYKKLPKDGKKQLIDGRKQVKSLMDDPGAAWGLSQEDWVHLIVLHLIMHGETFLLHIFGGGGQLVGLLPVHPTAVTVNWSTDKERPGKVFNVSLGDGTLETYYTDEDKITQIMGPTLDGLRGINVLWLHRRTMSRMAAEDDAAANNATTGFKLAGILTSDEDVEEAEGALIKKKIDEKTLGPEHTGGTAMINRHVKFQPTQQTGKDSEIIQSREFSVNDASRMYGVPGHLLGSMEKSSSWGTGIIEMNLALAKYTLNFWCDKIEAQLSKVLPNGQFCEFDFHELLSGSPQQESEVVLSQFEAGVISKNEAREKLGYDPTADPADDTPASPPPPVIAPDITDTKPNANPDQGEGK